jgi:copper chaperone CopZ
MKNFQVAINAFLFVVVVTIFTTSEIKAQSAEIIIQTTAQCKECKENIEKALINQKGVKFAELDIKTKQAKVVYNPNKITPEKLREVISKTGYDADDVPADSAAVQKLSPCCTKDGHRE